MKISQRVLIAAILAVLLVFAIAQSVQLFILRNQVG
jgi:hypothetical protein